MPEGLKKLNRASKKKGLLYSDHGTMTVEGDLLKGEKNITKRATKGEL